MITSLADLRINAVKHVLRQGFADYLLRHALTRHWLDSQQYDEMAWTDFRKLYFNIKKLNRQLSMFQTSLGGYELDDQDHRKAFLAAASHEILHILWLHKYRGKTKAHPKIWSVACEYAINFEVVKYFGRGWIEQLGVMYPPQELIDVMHQQNFPFTTDGFYDALCANSSQITIPDVKCQFHRRCRHNEGEDQEKVASPGTSEVLKVLGSLPVESEERQDIVRFLTSQEAARQKIPWEMLLLGGIEDAMSQEQTWAFPSRRNNLLPGWRHEKYLNFVWILDVSPSIDDNMKQSFVNTLQAGINLYHDAVHRVIFFAEGIVEDFVVSSGTNLINREIPCGDGTDLRAVWEILDRDLPEYALVLTDLEMSPVPQPTFTKVIWGIVGNYAVFDPDYGVKIKLD